MQRRRSKHLNSSPASASSGNTADKLRQTKDPLSIRSPADPARARSTLSLKAKTAAELVSATPDDGTAQGSYELGRSAPSERSRLTPARPVLSLKRDAPAEPTHSPTESVVEATKPDLAEPEQESAGEVPAIERPIKPWTRSQVVKAGLRMARISAELNELLVAPIAVLVAAEGDVVKPFKLGLGDEIKALLKPATTQEAFEKSIRGYVFSLDYQLAAAQPDSMRHDIDGNPVEPVSKVDRFGSQTLWIRRLAALKKRREAEREAKMVSPTPDPAGCA